MIPNAHAIQTGLYNRKNTSVHRLLGFDANHKLWLFKIPEINGNLLSGADGKTQLTEAITNLDYRLPCLPKRILESEQFREGIFLSEN